MGEPDFAQISIAITKYYNRIKRAINGGHIAFWFLHASNSYSTTRLPNFNAASWGHRVLERLSCGPIDIRNVADVTRLQHHAFGRRRNGKAVGSCTRGV